MQIQNKDRAEASARTDAAAAETNLDLAVCLITRLKERKQTIAACESLTAGLFCSALGGVPGASAVFKGGLVTYFTAIKEQIAHVPAALLEEYGAVSRQCAAAMAVNVRKMMEADYGVSFTGNAGPDGMENKPAGLVFCAIADASGVSVYEFQLKLPRNLLRTQVVNLMLDACIHHLADGTEAEKH